MKINWQPIATLEMLRLRAAALAGAREYFKSADVLEIETPVTTACPVTDPQTGSVAVPAIGWLRTSPEYHMKRLLAAHGQAIYQIGKVFRQGELGRNHQPEFTMIEWYRPGFELDEMIEDCCQLIMAISASCNAVNFPTREITYHELFMKSCNLDLSVASLDDIKSQAMDLLGESLSHELADSLGEDEISWLDLLYSHVATRQMPEQTLNIVRDYPAEQAMLARLNPNNPQVADRFEVFLNGIELANGFCELLDAEIQAARFQQDNERRAELGRPEAAIDSALIAALKHGLPKCSGVSVGLDRLLMLCSGSESVEQTLSFRPGN